MPLSIFIDALPFSEVKKNYSSWFVNEQIAKLEPNIGYSSVLHWQLYCNKYPDQRLKFLDWQKKDEKSRFVRFLSTLFRPLDCVPPFAFICKKVFDRIIFKKNVFANIPFKFRKIFSENSMYLFWDHNTYSKEQMFIGYSVISQDEGHLSFSETIKRAKEEVLLKKDNIFIAIGEIDHQGHMCARDDNYSKKISVYMDEIKNIIQLYLSLHPSEEVLIVSDHGMSTINNYVDFNLRKKFGKQSKKTYIAYTDSCVMCIWSENNKLLSDISDYLLIKSEGHLLTERERERYKVTNSQFGNLIYILKEGNCFKNNWFGYSLKKHHDGQGMHGFWPKNAKDQFATIMLINSNKKINDFYNYEEAYSLIDKVMVK